VAGLCSCRKRGRHLPPGELSCPWPQRKEVVPKCRTSSWPHRSPARWPSAAAPATGNRPAVHGRLVLRVGSLPLPAEVLLAPPAANQEDIANLLRGTPRLNVLITRTVPGVSGQCRTAVIGLKPIDRALTITSLMTAAMSVNGAALARYTIARRRGTNEGVLCTHRTGTAGRGRSGGRAGTPGRHRYRT
jgi:hypothetical protein